MSTFKKTVEHYKTLHSFKTVQKLHTFFFLAHMLFFLLQYFMLINKGTIKRIVIEKIVMIYIY